MKTIEWNGCYDASWKGVITADSFAHPAKFSRGLIERIFDHCLERGYLKRGDIVADCFGGIGTGGIIAAYRGLNWVGVELEERFVKLARQNFLLHETKWEQLGFQFPRIIQGDSREFAKLIGQACAVVSSPPFAGTSGTGGGGINVKGYVPAPGRKWTGDHADPVGGRTYQGAGGDRSPGNIETLKEGTVQAVVSSPPFQDSIGTKDEKFWANHNDRQRNWNGATRTTSEYGETYWQAVAAVYRQCFEAIRPDGVIVLVVKDYVKAGKRVPLCADTARLLEHIGFTPLDQIYAMLTSTTRHSDLFNGEDVKTKSRKSFFRRLAERKGSPAIDFEEVLIYQRP